MPPVAVPPFLAEGFEAVPLAPGAAPRRVVLVRLHAFGDTAAALPVIAGLKARHPGCRVEVVTGPPSGALFRARADVDAVHLLDARSGRVARFLTVRRLARVLSAEKVDAFLDLQRSPLSRALGRALRAPASCLFDRFAPKHCLERYLEAAEGVVGPLPRVFAPRTRPDVVERARSLLRAAGCDGRPLVLLNPAAGWPTRQWPIDRWAELGRALASAHGAALLLCGSGEALPRLAALKEALGAEAVDLAGRTDPGVAMAAVAACAVAVSEDSGLMHLAWVQGVPTVALFGASRAVWSRPAGPGSSVFGSEDLGCGACMSPSCARGDLHCLVRVSVEEVLAKVAEALRAPRPAAPSAG